MSVTEQLELIYSEYAERAEQAEQESGLFDGVLGMGSDPKKDPCHMAFYERLEAWVSDFRKQQPGPEEAFEAAEYILMAADSRRGQNTYWFCYAAQGLAEKLVNLLRPEQCRDLAERYEACYPRRDRMPVQKNVLRRLKKRSREK